jgi:hypothetical protein
MVYYKRLLIDSRGGLIHEVSWLRVIGMICGRSAMLTLIACFLLAAFSHGPQSTQLSESSEQPLVSGHAGLSTVCPHAPQRSRRATFSRFTPWRNRLKTVLKETELKIIEACNFGSSILRGRLITSDVVELVVCHFSSRPPLRC